MSDEVVNKVYTLRKNMNITQEELANTLGVTRQTVIAVEKGNYTPSVLLALKIAAYFKQPVEQVFKLKA